VAPYTGELETWSLETRKIIVQLKRSDIANRLVLPVRPP